MNLGQDFLAGVPRRPGVYFFLDAARRPLYVGKALDLRNRLTSYWKLRPGDDREHLLSMLEATRALTWQICASEKAAIRLESRLIRDILPPFNIAGTGEPTEFFVALVAPETMEGITENTHRFELRFKDPNPGEGEHLFGCVRNDRCAKSGYPALLRLLFLLEERARWYHYPAPICRPYLPYQFESRVPAELLPPLRHFLAGKSLGFLREISLRLLELESLPGFLAPTIQADLAAAREFYRRNLKLTHLAKKSLGPTARRALLKPAQLRHFIRKQSLTLVPQILLTDSPA